MDDPSRKTDPMSQFERTAHHALEAASRQMQVAAACQIIGDEFGHYTALAHARYYAESAVEALESIITTTTETIAIKSGQERARARREVDRG